MRPELRRILDDLPGLEPVLERAVERYVRLSRVGGTVRVEPKERRAVERLGCRLDGRGRVKLTELDLRFRESRLAASLPEVLEEYLGAPLVTRDERSAREHAEWTALKARIYAPGQSSNPPPPASSAGSAPPASPPEWVRRWLEGEERALRSEWRRQDAAWALGLERAIRGATALDAFEEAGIELPLLAERALGDSHGLDSDRIAGRLFERLLVHRHERAGYRLPLSAEDREGLLALSGLAIDEVSSTVHVVGLGGADPLLAAARAGRHVLALPLRTVYAVRDGAHAHRDVVFAVENRSVFSALHRALSEVTADRHPTLVCTGGHVSLAALRLLDGLVAVGAIVRYSGDFDAKGLMIADALAERIGPSFEPWRMGTDAYLRAVEGRPATPRIDPGPFARGAVARFPELARLVRERGAAYQEGWVEGLAEDLRTWSDG